MTLLTSAGPAQVDMVSVEHTSPRGGQAALRFWPLLPFGLAFCFALAACLFGAARAGFLLAFGLPLTGAARTET